uniref:Uncharacterized protein n=1 Tax=viral metagenome TaxID=1070528 RepID=A0A6M3XLQ9_9ZZZZ
MAIKVKSVTDVRNKWLDVTPGRAAYYEKEAAVAGSDWEKGAIEASSAFKAGISAANIEQLFKGGIKRAGAAKYERKVKDVGVARFSQGVSAAGPDFEAGVSPFLDEIAKITLPPRQPRGSEANFARVRDIGVALHKKRLALRAAGA